MSTMSPTPTATSGNARAVRPFYWSLRRELWEHRAIYIAPAVFALLLLLALVAVAFKLPEAMTSFDSFPPLRQREIASAPYAGVALVLIIVATIVALFYCLDALYGERRDRSALFWKSLPVSDRTTVLAKLAVPMLVVPVFLFMLICATQLIVLLGHTALWWARGLSVGNLLLQLPLFDMPLGVAHFLITQAIWYAPIYAWLMLVSAWAQRSPVVWALLPWLGLAALERMAFGSSHVTGLVRDRFFGNFDAAFSARESVAQIVERAQQSGAAVSKAVQQADSHTPDVLRFLSTPGVWIGIAVAIALIMATIWLRRRQESQSS